MVLVGGMGSLWGSIFGTVLLTLLPELLHAVKDYNVLIQGLILTGVLVFFPEGLFPGILEAWRKRRVVVHKRSVSPGREP
jgi:branched-chain amino acid transport system permease protein